MSINRDMEPYMLQEVRPIRSPSGAETQEWTDVEEISIAVYKTNGTKVVASAKYMESTHTGLTYRKDITADRCRLAKDGKVYVITDCNSGGRLTNLLLKGVE